MIDVKFNNEVINFIEEHARQNKGKEIYGWLLGYEEFVDSKKPNKRKIQRVIAAYSCHSYLQQTTINSEPDPQELSALISLLPKKIYNIGMYHSHPVGVFHSHTDDRTLLQMKKIYPEVISIVTNGKETHCYKTLEKQVKEIDIVMDHIDSVFSLIRINTNISFIKSKNYYIIASQFENDLEQRLKENWSKIKQGDRSIVLDLYHFDYGTDFAFPVIIRSTIFGLTKSISMNEVIDTVKKAGYELIASIVKPKNGKTLQTGVIDYFGIPAVIYPNSYVRKKAKDRAKLISQFNKENAKLWKQL